MKRLMVSSICLVLLSLLVSSNILFAGSKDLKIAMILWRGETRAEQGFKSGLKQLGYSAQYTIMNAAQDRKELARLLRNELEPRIAGFDYVYTFGTTVSKVTRTFLNDRIPHIFVAVTAPVESGIVDSMGSSGGNVGGIKHGIDLSLQIGTALKVINFKRLGFIFNPREKNSNIQRKELYAIAKNYDFEVIDLRSPPAQNMLQKNLQKLIDKSITVDAVYLPLDSFLISKAKLIGSRLRAAKVKSIGAHRKFITNGVMLGVIPDYYELGKVVATIVDRHQHGKKLENIPIETVKEPGVIINKTTSKMLNISIPEAVLKKATIVE